MKSNVFIAVIISLISLKLEANDCQRNTLLKEYVHSSSMVMGIGESSNKDLIKAKNEARSRAYQDMATQLVANVEATNTLSETQQSNTYESIVIVTSKLENIKGIQLVKEEKVKKQFCTVYTLDVQRAYQELKEEFKTLDGQLELVLNAKRKKDYINLMRLYTEGKKVISNSTNSIELADIYKTFLKNNDPSWVQKYKKNEVDLDKSLDEAKEKVIFYLTDLPAYRNMILETENLISSQGFKVKIGGLLKKSGIQVEFKEVLKPRKAQTSLGHTLIYNVSVVIRDLGSRRTLGANRSVNVQGFSKNDDHEEAVASASAQMRLVVMELLEEAIPGIFKE